MSRPNSAMTLRFMVQISIKRTHILSNAMVPIFEIARQTLLITCILAPGSQMSRPYSAMTLTFKIYGADLIVQPYYYQPIPEKFQERCEKKIWNYFLESQFPQFFQMKSHK